MRIFGRQASFGLLRHTPIKRAVLHISDRLTGNTSREPGDPNKYRNQSLRERLKILKRVDVNVASAESNAEEPTSPSVQITQPDQATVVSLAIVEGPEHFTAPQDVYESESPPATIRVPTETVIHETRSRTSLRSNPLQGSDDQMSSGEKEQTVEKEAEQSATSPDLPLTGSTVIQDPPADLGNATAASSSSVSTVAALAARPSKKSLRANPDPAKTGIASRSDDEQKKMPPPESATIAVQAEGSIPKTRETKSTAATLAAAQEITHALADLHNRDYDKDLPVDENVYKHIDPKRDHEITRALFLCFRLVEIVKNGIPIGKSLYEKVEALPAEFIAADAKTTTLETIQKNIDLLKTKSELIALFAKRMENIFGSAVTQHIKEFSGKNGDMSDDEMTKTGLKIFNDEETRSALVTKITTATRRCKDTLLEIYEQAESAISENEIIDRNLNNFLAEHRQKTEKEAAAKSAIQNLDFNAIVDTFNALAAQAHAIALKVAPDFGNHYEQLAIHLRTRSWAAAKMQIDAMKTATAELRDGIEKAQKFKEEYEAFDIDSMSRTFDNLRETAKKLDVDIPEKFVERTEKAKALAAEKKWDMAKTEANAMKEMLGELNAGIRNKQSALSSDREFRQTLEAEFEEIKMQALAVGIDSTALNSMLDEFRKNPDARKKQARDAFARRWQTEHMTLTAAIGKLKTAREGYGQFLEKAASEFFALKAECVSLYLTTGTMESLLAEIRKNDIDRNWLAGEELDHLTALWEKEKTVLKASTEKAAAYSRISVDAEAMLLKRTILDIVEELRKNGAYTNQDLLAAMASVYEQQCHVSYDNWLEHLDVAGSCVKEKYSVGKAHRTTFKDAVPREGASVANKSVEEICNALFNTVEATKTFHATVAAPAIHENGCHLYWDGQFFPRSKEDQLKNEYKEEYRDLVACHEQTVTDLTQRVKEAAQKHGRVGSNELGKQLKWTRESMQKSGSDTKVE